MDNHYEDRGDLLGSPNQLPKYMEFPSNSLIPKETSIQNHQLEEVSSWPIHKDYLRQDM